jgi:hypothetical protein
MILCAALVQEVCKQQIPMEFPGEFEGQKEKE